MRCSPGSSRPRKAAFRCQSGSRAPIAADMLQQWWRATTRRPAVGEFRLQSINAEKGAELLRTFGGQLIHGSFMFFFSLLTLFVLLRNGRWIAHRSLETADRIFGDPGEGLAGKMTEAIRAIRATRSATPP